MGISLFAQPTPQKHAPKALRSVSYTSPRFERFKPSAIFDAYWTFATERQAIFFRRLTGLLPPWTDNPILSRYKFTNVYRASDRVSQYLIREVIYKGDQTLREIFFRVLLFKFFNKIETWKLLLNSFDEPLTTATSLDAISNVLLKAQQSGLKIYSGAYIMPSGTGSFRSQKKHESHLRVLKHMLDKSVPERLGNCQTMREAFSLLRSFPMFGDFLAYQYVTDLNYSDALRFSESEFVVPGPGARSGIQKCFQTLDGMTESDLIKMVADEQEREFARLEIQFQYLPERPLQYIDCQNIFCEIDKYSRISHPEICGRYGKKRIKQLFRPTAPIPALWYPPKWGINDRLPKVA